MTKANWKEAPHDAETYEQFMDTKPNFCKGGYFWDSNEWIKKGTLDRWTILEHRPRIIAWEDMKEGMIVRCVDTNEDGNWYRLGEECTVGLGKNFEFGPMNDEGRVTRWPERYTFELVSEPEQRKAEREQEWTHVVAGLECKIICNEPDKEGEVPIFVKGQGYGVEPLVGLQPIKPTITKEEAWDMASEHAVSVAYIKEHNNIID